MVTLFAPGHLHSPPTHLQHTRHSSRLVLGRRLSVHTVGEYEAAQSRAACSVRPEPTIGALNTLHRASQVQYRHCCTPLNVGIFLFTPSLKTLGRLYICVYHMYVHTIIMAFLHQQGIALHRLTGNVWLWNGNYPTTLH